jgi:hypothetical protein
MTDPVIPEPRPGVLDVRLTRPGPPLSTADLIAVWADHCPPHTPLPESCRDCGHVYTPAAILCPTEAVIRHTLHRRGITPTVDRLTLAQRRDLLDRQLPNRAHAVAERHRPPQTGKAAQPALFDLQPTPATTTRTAGWSRPERRRRR